MATNSQIAANRANVQLSTGPKSDDGKAKGSLNALDDTVVLSEPKIRARTGRTVLLPSDDIAAFEQHLDVRTRRHAA